MAFARFWVPFDADIDLPTYYEAINVSRSLAETGAFADPFQTARTGSTAHLSPAFPALLSLLHYRSQGDNEFFFRAVFVETCALALCAMILPWISERAGFGLRPGVIGALCFIVLPPGRSPMWESHQAGALALLATGNVLAWHEKGASPGRAALAGGVWGGTLLTSAATAPVFLGAIILSAMRPVPKRAIAVCLGTAALMLLPWSLRNRIELGEFVALRSNLGLELVVSNNECAQPTFQGNLDTGCFDLHHPNHSMAQVSRLIAQGEVGYNRSRRAEALEWMAANPTRVIKLVRERILLYWTPFITASIWPSVMRIEPSQYNLPSDVITLISFIGVILLVRTRRRSAHLLFAWLLLFPGIFYFIQSDARYRCPSIWVTYLFAGYAISSLLSRLYPEEDVSGAAKDTL